MYILESSSTSVTLDTAKQNVEISEESQEVHDEQEEGGDASGHENGESDSKWCTTDNISQGLPNYVIQQPCHAAQ